eukprot:15462420-Alexandrium_andersonii.AAC.1
MFDAVSPKPVTLASSEPWVHSLYRKRKGKFDASGNTLYSQGDSGRRLFTAGPKLKGAQG